MQNVKWSIFFYGKEKKYDIYNIITFALCEVQMRLYCHSRSRDAWSFPHVWAEGLQQDHIWTLFLKIKTRQGGIRRINNGVVSLQVYNVCKKYQPLLDVLWIFTHDWYNLHIRFYTDSFKFIKIIWCTIHVGLNSPKVKRMTSYIEQNHPCVRDPVSVPWKYLLQLHRKRHTDAPSSSDRRALVKRGGGIIGLREFLNSKPGKAS